MNIVERYMMSMIAVYSPFLQYLLLCGCVGVNYSLTGILSLDKTVKGSLAVLKRCPSFSSVFVTFVTRCGILVGCIVSLVGSSAQFCCHRFVFSMYEIFLHCCHCSFDANVFIVWILVSSCIKSLA